MMPETSNVKIVSVLAMHVHAHTDPTFSS